MTRLILLNGPPGSGKSTLARRYAEGHPLTLALDIDRVRAAIGGWADQPETAGLLARDVAVAAAQAHLANGHDVVVAQFVARPGFVERLEAIATRLDIDFQEIVADLQPAAVTDPTPGRRRRWQRSTTGC